MAQKIDLKCITEGSIILAETTVDNVMELNVSIIKELCDKNYTGIILSASRPYANLSAMYKKNGIDTEGLFFLDCITGSGDHSESAANVLYIDNASDLTKILIAINDVLIHVKGNKFLLFDSVPSMLIHNQPMLFARFIHGMLTKLRIQNVGGVLLSFQSDANKDIRAEIAQLCDKVVSV
jgi:hypothetical protein